MDDLIHEIKTLEKRARKQDLENNRLSRRITKVHSYAFLKRKPIPVLQRHKQRLEKRISQSQQSQRERSKISIRGLSTQEEPSPLYASDWMTIVSTLAKMAKESSEACVIALGLGDLKQDMRTGLLWVVSADHSTKLVNKKAFEATFRTCQNRKGTRYIMGLLSLISRTYGITNSHILSYIYDIKQNEIEVFDPNGGLQFAKDIHSDEYAEFIDHYYKFHHFHQMVTGYFMNILGIRNVYMPGQWCPVGIQQIEEQQKPQSKTEKEKDFGGYCAAWSIWWLQQRLQYPNVKRTQLIILLTKQFEEQNVNLKQYVQSFAKQLSVTKTHLMRTALSMGGRQKEEIDQIMKNYCRAETICRSVSNLLYHESKERRSPVSHDVFIANGSSYDQPSLQQIEMKEKRICLLTKQYTTPVLAEVKANLEDAVRLFSNGRIALSSLL